MSTRQPQQQQARYEQFPCNYFQIISVQLNIRYNGGITLPAVATVNQVAMFFYQIMSQLGANAQVGLLPSQQPAPSGKQVGKPVILRQIIDRTPGSTGQKLNFAPPVVAPAQDRSLVELITSNLYPAEPLPAAGPARLFLYTKEDGDVSSPPTANSIVTALVINVNAALWDAVTLKTVLTAFANNFATQIEGKKSVPIQIPLIPKLGGWIKIIHDHLQQQPPREPKFLPVGEEGEVATKIEEILPATTQNSDTTTTSNPSDRRVWITIDAETVASCHQKVPEKSDLFTAPLADFGVACFTYALAEIYFRSNPDKEKLTVAFAIQIDPRVAFKDLLLDQEGGQSTGYLHAISVLSMGRTVHKSEVGKEDSDITDWLLKETKRVGGDITKRMERGEGLTKALELATGQFDKDKMVHSAVELVDHGTYATHSHPIELGHRFDLCELMSAVVHVEDSGELKLQAQIGKNQDREGTLALLARMAELWKQVAAS